MAEPAGKAGVQAGGQLQRVLGPVDATTIVVGGIIGSGIFLAPSLVARQVASPGQSLLVWLLAGVLATCGALCFAELGAAIPETGGTYAFLKRIWRSPFIAFLFGWTFFFVDGGGSIAAVATAFAIYTGFFLEGLIPWGPLGVKLVAVGSILMLSAINFVGVRAGSRLQNLLTLLKLGLLGAIVFIAFTHAPHPAALPSLVPAGGGIRGIAVAMIPTLFAYAGWTFSTYVGGEVKDPAKNVPRSILIGMAVVVLVYLAVNAAYLRALPFDRLRASTLVASDAMTAVIGPRGGALVAGAVVISTLGALNAGILSYPRIGFAMAQDGLFFQNVAKVHPRFGTPGMAIVAQAVVAGALAVSGSYERILGYFSFIDYVFFCGVIVGVMVLRRREPGLPRPYRTWGYPITPLLFLLISGAYLGTLLTSRLADSMVGVGLMVIGIPFYFFWRRATTPPHSWTRASRSAR